MINKNDPLIAAVQKVMQNNQAERDAVRVVNEKFGITDRRALSHERQSEWDAAYKKVLTEGVEALAELKAPTKKNVKDVENRAFNKMRAAMDDRDPETFEKAHKIEKMAQRKSVKLGEDTLAEDELNDKGKGPKKKVTLYRHKTSGKEINTTNHPGDEWEVVKEELKGNQHKIDANKNGRVDGQDFKILRKVNEDDTTSPSSMGIKKPDYAPAGTTPDYAKPTTQTVNRAEKTSLPAGTIKEAIKTAMLMKKKK